jgi:hypothetical protein
MTPIAVPLHATGALASSRLLWSAVGIAAITRLVVCVAAYGGGAAAARIDERIRPPLGTQETEWRRALRDADHTWHLALQRRLFDFTPLLRWDAGHYRTIVERGYQPGPDDRPPEQIAFFPLYPLLSAATARVFGTATAMILVSHVAALAAAALLAAWARRWCDNAAALLCVTLVFTWPSAHFYSFGYAESLTLLLVAGTLWSAADVRPGLAAAMCGLATATRPTAVAVAVPLLIWSWQCGSSAAAGAAAISSGHVTQPRAEGFPARSRVWRLMGLGLLATSGLSLYVLYLLWSFGSPVEYLSNFRHWVPAAQGRDWLALVTLARIWDQFRYFGRALADAPASLEMLSWALTWNMPATLTIVILSLAAWRRAPRALRPWLLIGPLIFALRYAVAGWSNFGVESMARYTMLSAPTYLALAVSLAGRRSGLAIALAALLLLLQSAAAFQFGMGEWTG